MELCKCTAVINSVLLYYRQDVACKNVQCVYAIAMWLILAPFDPLLEPTVNLLSVV